MFRPYHAGRTKILGLNVPASSFCDPYVQVPRRQAWVAEL